MQTRTITNRLPVSAHTAWGQILKPMQKHHTGKATKTTRDGATESFNIESVICGDGYKAANGGNWRTRAVTDRAKSINPTGVPRVKIPSAKRNNYNWVRKKLREATLRWLYTNRGHALSIGGPGARKIISGADEHLLKAFGEILQQQNDGNCIIAAITNAIDVICGREVAKRFQEHFFETNPHYLKIRQATLLLHELPPGVETRKIPKNDRETFNMNPFAYLVGRESVIYIVHIFQLKIVSHTLVIDANRKLIIYSAEKYPMRLSEDLLRKCGGDEAKDLKIDEVRLVVKQATSMRNNH